MATRDDFDKLLNDPQDDPPAPLKIPLVGSAVDYPTVYADGCLFATMLGTNVRLVFAETMLEASDSPHPGMKSRHVGTLVMPYGGFQAMLSYLNDRDVQFREQVAANAE